MNSQAFLARLEGVRERGAGRWSAKCPAHAPDKNPSLSIREGERGLLVHCWAGCGLEEVCKALGLTVRELFFDADSNSKERRPASRLSKIVPVDARHIAFRFELHALDLTRRAEAVIKAASDVNTSAWNSADLDQAVNAVASAYADLERAAVLEQVADDLRLRSEVRRAS